MINVSILYLKTQIFYNVVIRLLNLLHVVCRYNSAKNYINDMIRDITCFHLYLSE